MKTMTSAVIVTAALTFVLAVNTFSAPISAAKPSAYVHADGTILRDGDNRPLRLCGVNLGGWLLWEGWIWGGGLQSESAIRERLSEVVGKPAFDQFQSDVYSRFINDADIANIARAGMNVVRVPFNYRLLEDDANPGTYKPAGWRVLDDLLASCRKHKVYAVLDMHGAPGGQTWLFISDPAPRKQDRLWELPANQTRTINLWRAIASRYRDEPIVAGYDLLNEPAPPNGMALKDLYRRIIAAVREVDENHAIVIEGGASAQDFSMFDGPLTSNEIYSFHIYNWFGDDRQKRLSDWHALSARQNIPLWNGEFGENSLAIIQSTVKMFDEGQFGVSGYCFWTWKKVTDWSCGLATLQPPESWTQLIKWISRPTRDHPPGRTAALAAMHDFLQAVDAQRTTIDTRTSGALAQHPAGAN